MTKNKMRLIPSVIKTRVSSALVCCATVPKAFSFPGLGAAIDNLRISDVIRYEGDFEPSSMPLDFSFDGNLEGGSGNGKWVTGRLKP